MPITIYRRNGGKIWHYTGTVDGQRLRGSCKTADKRTAERIAADLENKAWKASIDGPGAILTFARAAILYRAAGKPTRFLARVEDYWKDTLVKDITRGAVKQAAIVIYPKASGATRNRNVIVPTQAIINYAASLDLCPPFKAERFKVETKKKKPATWEWVQSFMAHANPHLGALCAFMFLTGARISEAANLDWSDVDLTAATARINQTKVGRERIAHLPRPLVIAMANIEGERVGKVFRYSSRHTIKPQWNKVCKRAGIEQLSYHTCRHGFATSLLHKGVDPVTVAKLGGWADPQLVFRTYGHAREDMKLSDLLVSGTPEARAPSKQGINIVKSGG